MMSQKEAVFTIVTGYYGKRFSNGMTHSKEDRSKIVDMLVEAHGKGTFTIENKQENVRTYCIGLLNNHLRKDTRLNGGQAYVAKNPGSRTGIADPQVKALKQLLKNLPEGSAEAGKVQAAINAKIESAKLEKAKSSIDVDNLPAEFRSLVK